MLPRLRATRRICRFQSLLSPVPKHTRWLSTETSQPEVKDVKDETKAAPKRGLLDRLKKGVQPKVLNVSEKDGKAATRMIFRQSAELPIRTRFAPSPTGYLHLGSLRTALFNNLASTASKGGSFILRIEDTDQNRLVHDAEKRIIEDLKWFGLSWDEGPDKGGPHGPYRQSERLPVYKENIKPLLAKGRAYRCFCSPSDLEHQKRLQHDAGEATHYPGTCRSIDPSEAADRAAKGEEHVVRFKGRESGTPKLVDAIYGAFAKKEVEEDFILMKRDGFPTYHFANVVDDHLMEITHVVRGEEWLISTPKHIALYEAFGWKPPTFAHLGLLTNDDGSKLSKRNESANLATYKERGYSPMALQMWLANLGSSFIKSKHIPRTLSQVADLLTFKFTRGGIKLNPEKLDNFETQYRNAIIRLPHKDLSSTEDPLFDSAILQPTISTILALQGATTSSLAEWSDPAWVTEKDIVPQMGESTRKAYVEKIIRANPYTEQNAALLLVPRNPHYFYRPPPSLYEAAVSYLTDNERTVLRVLTTVCEEPDWWSTDDGALGPDQLSSKLPMQGIQAKLLLEDIDTATVHRVLRLVATGTPDISSQPSGMLFAILGQEEWKFRVGLVSRMVKEL